jgi:hypothetical protein
MKPAFASLISVLAALAVGCARTTVSPEQQYSGGPLPRPQMVLVYDFAYSSAQITANGSILHKALVDAQGTTVAEQDQEIGAEVANMMANKIAAGINGLGLQAMIAESNAPIPPNSVIVTGEFGWSNGDGIATNGSDL